MKQYKVNEIFYTIQGEGCNSGRAAVFCRFSLCNLWTGREEDRARAICQFCDTDFLANTKYTLDELLLAIDRTWGAAESEKMVVFTGGEPALQLDKELVQALRDMGYYVAVESNGTLELPDVDWLCISPKAGSDLPESIHADEIKLVFPQPGLMPDDLLRNYTLTCDSDAMWLSPMDGPNLADNTAAAVRHVLADPAWRLNIQIHKIVGVR